jgi:hypothetical protein
MPPDGLAELEAKRVWGLWDYHDPKTKLLKIFIPVAGAGGPTTLKVAAWALVHQLGTDRNGYSFRRQGIAAQLPLHELTHYRAALEAAGVEVFRL